MYGAHGQAPSLAALKLVWIDLLGPAQRASIQKVQQGASENLVDLVAETSPRQASGMRLSVERVRFVCSFTRVFLCNHPFKFSEISHELETLDW